MKRAIILFTRVPEPGRTKTRLQPEFTPKESSYFHMCCLKDLNRELRNSSEDIVVSFAPGGNADILRDIFGRNTLYIEQKGETLGKRMYNSICEVLKSYDSCVLMGTDIPEVSYGDIDRAFQILEERDAVFGPTTDGGYYLVGMNKAIEAVFSVKTYGHSTVLRDTLNSISQSMDNDLNKNVTFGLTTIRQDVDTAKDAQELFRRMQRNHLRNTYTFRFLADRRRISVIIPIYNEGDIIRDIQRELYPIRNDCEIIFVDGGSTDGTCEHIHTCFKIVHSGKGRAVQMNIGAKVSTGDILFFLHADSRLPAKPIDEIKRVMQGYRVGGFGIRFESRNLFMYTNRLISNHRMKYRRIIFGDQGMFIERELFFKLGMFPNLPIMEDYQFSLTMRRYNIKIGKTRYPIMTSDRRYQGGTLSKLKVMYNMALLRYRYRQGVNINEIADRYRDIR